MSDVRQPVQSFNFCFINHPSESEKMERTRNATKKKWWANRVEQKSKVLSRKKEEIPSQTNGWWSEFGWRKWPSNNNNTPENTVDNTITKSTEDSLRQKNCIFFRTNTCNRKEWMENNHWQENSIRQHDNEKLPKLVQYSIFHSPEDKSIASVHVIDDLTN